jgi:hypothetical protein
MRYHERDWHDPPRDLDGRDSLERYRTEVFHIDFDMIAGVKIHYDGFPGSLSFLLWTRCDRYRCHLLGLQHLIPVHSSTVEGEFLPLAWVWFLDHKDSATLLEHCSCYHMGDDAWGAVQDWKESCPWFRMVAVEP